MDRNEDRRDPKWTYVAVGAACAIAGGALGAAIGEAWDRRHNGVELGSLGEWFSSFGGFAAVAVAFYFGWRERRHNDELKEKADRAAAFAEFRVGLDSEAAAHLVTIGDTHTQKTTENDESKVHTWIRVRNGGTLPIAKLTLNLESDRTRQPIGLMEFGTIGPGHDRTVSLYLAEQDVPLDRGDPYNSVRASVVTARWTDANNYHWERIGEELPSRRRRGHD